MSREKITEYKLYTNHAIGQNKAEFFTAFGFYIEDIEIFRKALIQHSVLREVDSKQSSHFGIKYKLLCEIQTPDGRNPCIVTVRIIDAKTNVPSLITAYPDR